MLQRPRGALLRRLLIDTTPLRLDRDFRLLIAGQAVSGLGNQMTRIVLPFQVYVLTGSTLAVALLITAQLIPSLVVVLGAGVLADAMDRRKLLLIAQLGLSASTLGLAFLAILPEPPLAAIVTLAAVAAALTSVDQTARSSAIPRLVPPERLTSAIAINQLSNQVASIVGPALGGIVLSVAGPAAAYAIDGVSYLVIVVAVLGMRPIPPLAGMARPGIAAIREGLRFARHRPVIFSSLIIDVNAMVFGMPSALFPVLALEVFRTGPVGVGLLAAAPAVGAVIAAIFSGWVSRIRRPGRATVYAVVVWGVAITGFGFSTFSFPLALMFLAIAGGADVLSAVFRGTMVQLEAPDELRGRVAAIRILTVTSGPRLGDIEAAGVASLIGAQASVVSGGLLSLVGTLVIVRRYPQLWRYVIPTARPAPVTT
jgi:MFS family permease